MFDGPEYVSYIELCRALRLDRTAKPGDWFLSWDPKDPNSVPIDMALSMRNDDGGGPAWADQQEDWWTIWLPRLDQWLTMLEDAGVAKVEMGKHPSEECYAMDVNSTNCGFASTREEAAARLWKAIVDEIAQREGVTSY